VRVWGEWLTLKISSSVGVTYHTSAGPPMQRAAPLLFVNGTDGQGSGGDGDLRRECFDICSGTRHYDGFLVPQAMVVS
jgi:hypothetical protein